MIRSHRKWWKLAALCMGMLGVIVALHLCGVRWSEVTPERVRAYIQSYGWWSPLVYMVMYTQPVVPLPVTVMSMAAGLSFGVIGGLGLTVVAATIRGCGQFLIARLLGREAVEAILRGHLARLDARIGREGFRTVFWIRVIPNIPFDLQNFSLGFSRIPLQSFALATLIGMLPGVLLWVYIGHSLTQTRHAWRIGAAIIIFAAFWYAAHRYRHAQRRSHDPH